VDAVGREFRGIGGTAAGVAGTAPVARSRGDQTGALSSECQRYRLASVR
jgi:hypothetical protein